MNKSSKIKPATVDSLAVLVKGEFERITTKMDRQFDELKGDIIEFKSKMSSVERDIAAIKHHLVYREEFSDLESRVKLLETRMSVKSGR